MRDASYGGRLIFVTAGAGFITLIFVVELIHGNMPVLAIAGVLLVILIGWPTLAYQWRGYLRQRK